MKQAFKVAFNFGGYFFILLAFLLTLSTCEQADTNFRRAVQDALKSPNIDAAEFATLRQLVRGNPELNTKYPDDSAIKALILEMGEKMSHRRSNPVTWPFTVDTGVSDTTLVNTLTPGIQQPEMHFFYENSASMDGYLNGNTHFNDAVLSILSLAYLKKDKINLYYINREAYPVNQMIGDFVEYLKPSNVKSYGAQGRGNSEINRILQIVCDTVVNNPNRVGVVVSDYIYSIEGKDVSKQLNFQKATTTTNLSKLNSGQYSVLVIKIESLFDGLYYDMVHPTKGIRIKENRPVFLWVMGTNEKIAEFLERYEIKQLRGYQNHLILQKENATALPYYSILARTSREGRFEKTNRNSQQILAIEELECNRDDIFQFSLAVDLSKVPATSDYFTNPASYRVTSDKGDLLTVTEVLPIEKIDNNDKAQKGTATHILVLKGGKLSKGEQLVNITLAKTIPAWVAECSTECDTTTQQRQGKTFGFSYLIDGAKRVFEYNENSKYFSLPITIKR